MNSRTNTTNEDIINEITGIEYEDDDALTLLDDEEMQNAAQETDDEDLNSFYLDYPEKDQVKEAVDLYTEEVLKKEEKVVPTVAQSVKEPESFGMPLPMEKMAEPKPAVEEKNNGYQNKLNQLSTNIDAYLNGSLDNRKDEIKVEKMESVVVKAPVMPATPVQPIQPKPTAQPKEQPSVRPAPVVVPTINQPSNNVNMNNNSQNIDNNLSQLFAQASDSVRGASNVKKKMEDKFKELQKLYEDFENKKKADYAEINAYKDEVYNKLKVRKDEIDEQAKQLKLEQDTLANQKKQFEIEKQKMKDEAKKKEQELLDAFKEREKQIEQVENGLIRRKEQLDLEKVKIAKEKSQCEQEKKELAENLVKFNQLVDDFTQGVDRFNDNN